MSRTAADRRRAESVGRLAETATALLYMCLGFRPLAQRLRTPVGEIDLLARRGDLIAVVEVKLRDSTVTAAETITARNRRRIVDATRWWLAMNPEHSRYTIRFDAVLWAPWSLPCRVVGAFEAES